ncbi:MAG: hypothetical protein EBZ36_13520, partial [Acidobacteria bacterium]|nr:hypothetical protein [Acidobacteriota bacterium]
PLDDLREHLVGRRPLDGERPLPELRIVPGGDAVLEDERRRMLLEVVERKVRRQRLRALLRDGCAQVANANAMLRRKYRTPFVVPEKV